MTVMVLESNGDRQTRVLQAAELLDLIPEKPAMYNLGTLIASVVLAALVGILLVHLCFLLSVLCSLLSLKPCWHHHFPPLILSLLHSHCHPLLSIDISHRTSLHPQALVVQRQCCPGRAKHKRGAVGKEYENLVNSVSEVTEE